MLFCLLCTCLKFLHNKNLKIMKYTSVDFDYYGISGHLDFSSWIHNNY